MRCKGCVGGNLENNCTSCKGTDAEEGGTPGSG